MPIEVTCTSCSRRLRVPDKAAGKRIKCPKCASAISVPRADEPVTPQPVASTTEKTPVKKVNKPTEPGWFVKVGEDSGELGPVPQAKLDAWVAKGCLGEDSQLLREGSDQWQWATDLFPDLEGKQPTSPIKDDKETVQQDKGPSPKSKILAGTLGVFLGGLGIHRFYLGYTLIGILQIVVTLLTCVGLWWGVVEGILILLGKFDKDGQGRSLVDEK